MSAHAAKSIIDIVERVVGVPSGAVRSRNRAPNYLHARRVAAALILDQFPHMGAVEMARVMGFRDHSSSIFYRRQIEKRGVREHSDYMAAALVVAFRFGTRGGRSSSSSSGDDCVCPACGRKSLIRLSPIDANGTMALAAE